MLKNYLVTALRNLLRHKLYSLINIGGLSLGLAACLMIFLFVQSELSYDKWLPGHENIYRLEGTYHTPGKPDNETGLSPGPLAAAFKNRFPDMIEDSARLIREGFVVKYGDARFIENGMMTDPAFFKVFDLPMVAGNREQLFDGYDKVIISERLKQKYFGDSHAVGEILDMDTGQQQLQVVAVMKDLPENTHLEIDLLGHFDEQRYANYPWIVTWWLSSNVYTYFKLHQGVDAEQLLARFPDFVNSNAVLSPNSEDPRLPSEILESSLMPLADIHLHSPGRFQIKPTGDILVVYSFAGIAVLILVIAVINFTNLSTARASLRAQEIALRKVHGATRRAIIVQILGEAFVTVALAILVAFAIVESTLPAFNAFVEKILDFNIFSDTQVQLGLLGVLAVVSLGAGAHPALRISSFRPASVLHSKAAGASGSVKLRAILTTVQFTISIGLMITTAVIYSQLRYAQSIDVGFDRADKLLVRNMTFGPVADVATTIKQEIDRLPGVESTSFAARTIPLTGYWDPNTTVEIDGQKQTIKLESVPADASFLSFIGANLLAGRTFSEDRRADLLQIPDTDGQAATQSAIINETGSRQLGFASPAAAVGTTIQVPDAGTGMMVATTIVGVVNDMHLRSVREAIDNSMFLLREGPQSVLYVDLIPALAAETRSQIEEIWNRQAPDVPFMHQFVDESYSEYYEQDARRGEVFAYFSAFAILVSCLGLYGLASFAAERRIKEIGIRKVMGASVVDVVKLLTFQFSKPVLLANLMAWPIAWFVASDWLQGFEFRIGLSPLYFFAAGGTALLIACLTVAGHAYKTAQANPVLALKHE